MHKINPFSRPKAIFSLALIFVCYGAMAQSDARSKVGYLYMGGNRFDLTKYDEVSQGSPFYLPNWQKAMIQMPNDRVITNTDVKLNLLDNELYFIDSAGNELVTTDDIKSVTFNEGTAAAVTFITKNVFGNQGSSFPSGWYQLAYKGKAMLLKQHFKQMTQTRGYSSGPGEKVIETEIRSFIWYNGTLTRVKKLEEVADLLSNTAVNKWVAGKKGSSKNEKDWVECLQYFDSLQGVGLN